VRVLPVFVYPAGATPMSAIERTIASKNLSAHLQMARRMYRRMLENPLNGAPRGTFELGTWDPVEEEVQSVTSYHAEIAPLEVSVPQSTAALLAERENGSFSFAATVMDAVGCSQADCRTIFVAVIVDAPFFNAGMQKLNQGLDNGGGLGVFSWPDVRWSNLGNTACNEVDYDDWGANGCSHFLSTLVHELGHGFGLNHSWEYGGTGSIYAQTTSPSVMGYSRDNWIPGCGEGNEVANGSIPCSYPTSHALIDEPAPSHFPGELLADDRRVLGLNHGAFPGFEFIRSLDTPTGGGAWLYQRSAGVSEIPGQERLRFWPDVEAMNATVGLPIPQVWEPLNGWRVWVSDTGAIGSWVDVDVEFPWDIELTRIRIYSGHAGVTPVPGTYYDAPTHARVLRIDYGNPVATQLGSVLTGFDPLNQTIHLPGHGAPDRYRLQLARGATGAVSLRGLRFWGKRNGSNIEEEFFPAVEPHATASHATYAGATAVVVGSDQEVKPFSAAWDASSSWHSEAVPCGDWVSVTVTFPHEVTLGDVKVHTGHSGVYHVAETVQVERECTCRSQANSVGENCGVESASNCALAGGPGSQIFEHVTTTASGADTLVSFTPESSHRWKVAMHTPPSRQRCNVVVRGLRFFNESHQELFPARLVASGL